MFALIETNGASHIAIHIPHQGADKSLPALAAMLETNATFIAKGWRELSVRKPRMTISLGDRISVEDSETGELVVAESGAVIGQEFEIASPALFASNAKVLQKLRDEVEALRKERDYLKSDKTRLEDQIKALTELGQDA